MSYKFGIGKVFNRFLSDRSGNFSMIAGILLLPIIFACGLAIDAVKYNTVRETVRAAADEAALVGAMSKKDKLPWYSFFTMAPNYTEPNWRKAAMNAFDGQLTEEFRANFTDDAKPSISADLNGRIHVRLRTNMYTNFAPIFGKPIEIDIESVAEATFESKPLCMLSLNKTLASIVAGSGLITTLSLI